MFLASSFFSSFHTSCLLHLSRVCHPSCLPCSSCLPCASFHPCSKPLSSFSLGLQWRLIPACLSFFSFFLSSVPAYSNHSDRTTVLNWLLTTQCLTWREISRWPNPLSQNPSWDLENQVGGRKKRQIERVIDTGSSEPEVFMPFCGATLISEQVGHLYPGSNWPLIRWA